MLLSPSMQHSPHAAVTIHSASTSHCCHHPCDIHLTLLLLSIQYSPHHHHHYLSLDHEGRWGIADDFSTSFLHFSLFSTALWDLVNSRPVHCLMLSSYLFLCLPCLLPTFTVPCKMVLARPDEWDTRSYSSHSAITIHVASTSCYFHHPCNIHLTLL